MAERKKNMYTWSSIFLFLLNCSFLLYLILTTQNYFNNWLFNDLHFPLFAQWGFFFKNFFWQIWNIIVFVFIVGTMLFMCHMFINQFVYRIPYIDDIINEYTLASDVIMKFTFLLPLILFFISMFPVRDIYIGFDNLWYFIIHNIQFKNGFFFFLYSLVLVVYILSFIAYGLFVCVICMKRAHYLLMILPTYIITFGVVIVSMHDSLSHLRWFITILVIISIAFAMILNAPRGKVDEMYDVYDKHGKKIGSSSSHRGTITYNDSQTEYNYRNAERDDFTYR